MGFKTKKTLKYFFILLLFPSLLTIYSCSPAGILASGGGTAMVVAEGDKSLGTVVDDATIKVNLAAKFLSAGNNLFVDINGQRCNVIPTSVLRSLSDPSSSSLFSASSLELPTFFLILSPSNLYSIQYIKSFLLRILFTLQGCPFLAP